MLDKVKIVATGVKDMMADGFVVPDMSSLNLPELAFAGTGVGSANTTTTNNNQKTTNLGEANIYVTGGNNQDADELARTVADKINDMLDEDSSCTSDEGLKKCLKQVVCYGIVGVEKETPATNRCLWELPIDG